MRHEDEAGEREQDRPDEPRAERVPGVEQPERLVRPGVTQRPDEPGDEEQADEQRDPADECRADPARPRRHVWHAGGVHRPRLYHRPAC